MDANALIFKNLTSGVVKIDPVNGLCEVTINPADTAALEWIDTCLFADFQGVDPAGSVWTLARGMLVVNADVTRTVP